VRSPKLGEMSAQYKVSLGFCFASVEAEAEAEADDWTLMMEHHTGLGGRAHVL